MTSIQSTDLRRRVREVLDRLRRDQEPVIVCTYDTPQAVLIPYEQYQAYQAWQRRQAEHRVWFEELRAIAEKVSDRAALADDEAAYLIDEAARASRELGGSEGP